MRRWIAVAALVALLVGVSSGVAGGAGRKDAGVTSKSLDALEYTTFVSLTRPISLALTRMSHATATARSDAQFAAAARPAEHTLVHVARELRGRGSWPGPAHRAVGQVERDALSLARDLQRATAAHGRMQMGALKAAVADGKRLGSAVGTVEGDLIIPFIPGPHRS